MASLSHTCSRGYINQFHCINPCLSLQRLNQSNHLQLCPLVHQLVRQSLRHGCGNTTFHMDKSVQMRSNEHRHQRRNIAADRCRQRTQFFIHCTLFFICCGLDLSAVNIFSGYCLSRNQLCQPVPLGDAVAQWPFLSQLWSTVHRLCCEKSYIIWAVGH